MTGRVLVTGARRGIGAAAARALAASGTTVVLHHLGAPLEIAMVAAQCRDLGGEVLVLEADLSVAADVAALAKAAGPVDVLVNNAARASNVGLDALSIAEWNATFAVNVTAPMLLAQALAPGMATRGTGRIINITSATVRMGGPSGPSYVASKAALVGLTRSLARTLGPSGVTVNAISPGAIMTESEVELAAGRTPAEIDAEVFERQALRRRLVPDDLMAAVRWLAGDGAAGVTGQVIEVGGGLVYR
ncbi:SDR family oxidoreductase [Dactylosporangium sp. NPDC050588]|uniref:SDR family NAD(P)-dependent oxidoreductase n=1 Tax=Dactylosporangium sp. NPDC050588 TaxID=3157211 RepID=UPI0033D1ED30